MSSRNSTDWMWAQACALIDDAERMHRQFFRLGMSERTQAVWEPPVDVFEDEQRDRRRGRAPGRCRRRQSKSRRARRKLVRAEARFPFAGPHHVVRRLEIPYGHFERRIPLPVAGLEAAGPRIVERLPRIAAAQIDWRRETMNERTTADTTPASADANRRQDKIAESAEPAARPPLAPLPADALIIVPVRNVVLFPGMVLPLTVGRERSRAAAHEAARLQRPLGVLLQSNPDAEEPSPEDLHWVGTTANVLRYITGPDGAHHAICQGVKRFRVLQFLDGYPFMAAKVEIIDPVEHIDSDIEGRAHALKQRALETLQLLPQVPEEVVAALSGVTGPARLADFISGLMDISPAEKQALLETFDLKARLDKLLELLSHRIEVLKVSREIDERTRARSRI